MADFQHRRLLLAAAAAMIIRIEEEEERANLGNRRRRRRMWARQWLRRREEGRGIIDMVHGELRLEDTQSFRNFLRMDASLYQELVDRVAPLIAKQDTVMRQCITAEERLSITLRFLVTGETFKSLHYSSRIAANTVSVIVSETVCAIIEVLKDEIKVPSSTEEWKFIAHQFLSLWNFPHCLGALDGKHVVFRPPRSCGSYYRNYKGTNSIILLALVDANCKFIWINMGVNGRVNDANVFNSSNLKKALSDNLLGMPREVHLPGGTINIPHVIIADDAFPLDRYLMKPFRLRDLTEERRNYNYRLSRARRLVENAFGELSNKFRVLLSEISLSPQKVDNIVKSCCSLHNFILNRRPVHLRDEELEANNNLEPIRCLIGGNRAPNHAYEVRDDFVRYFNGVGRVAWQDEAVMGGNM